MDLKGIVADTRFLWEESMQTVEVGFEGVIGK